MFVYRNARDKHPTTLAGIMTSTIREMEDYRYLTANLKRKGICNLTYETDGEIATYKKASNKMGKNHQRKPL